MGLLATEYSSNSEEEEEDDELRDTHTLTVPDSILGMWCMYTLVIIVVKWCVSEMYGEDGGSVSGEGVIGEGEISSKAAGLGFFAAAESSNEEEEEEETKIQKKEVICVYKQRFLFEFTAEEGSRAEVG